MNLFAEIYTADIYAADLVIWKAKFEEVENMKRNSHRINSKGSPRKNSD